MSTDSQLQMMAQKHYGMTIHHIQPFASFYKKKAAYRVTTNQGTYVIKPFYGRVNRGNTKTQINQAYKLIQTLERLGYPHIPFWLQTKSGKPWVMFKHTPHYMMPFIEGRNIHFVEEEFYQLGKALAALHSCNIKHKKKRAISPTQNLINQFNDMHSDYCNHLKKLTKNSNASSWFCKNGFHCVRLTKKSLSILQKPQVKQVLIREKKLGGSIIHGDVTYPNIIIGDAQALYFIDWDTIEIGSSYYEIVKTLTNVTSFQPKLIGAVLNGYEEVKPLSSDEKLVLGALFAFPREAWIAAKAMINKRKTKIYPILKKTWKERLIAVEWMNEWASM